MAKLVKTDGTMIDVQPANGKAFSLKELYGLLGADDIDVVTTDDPRIWLILDGEYLLKDPVPAFNAVATNIYHAAGGVPNHPVHGDAIVCTPIEAGEDPRDPRFQEVPREDE